MQAAGTGLRPSDCLETRTLMAGIVRQGSMRTCSFTVSSRPTSARALSPRKLSARLMERLTALSEFPRCLAGSSRNEGGRGKE